MPSMPLRFWDDPDGSRFRASYFETYPGVWRHGDLVEFAPDGSSVIVGRSDSTLNRNGIRLGPADLYRVVEALPEVKEAMVVGVEETRAATTCRSSCTSQTASPRSRRSRRSERPSARRCRRATCPTRSSRCPRIPHTRTGKKLEVPAKRILMGAALEEVVDLGSVDSIAALREIAGCRPSAGAGVTATDELIVPLGRADAGGRLSQPRPWHRGSKCSRQDGHSRRPR